jgi:hypothetical protein
MKDSADRLFREPHIGPERLLARFDESSTALLALIALNLVAAPANLHRFDLAIVARHYGLAFFGQKGQNSCGRKNPAFGASPR